MKAILIGGHDQCCDVFDLISSNPSIDLMLSIGRRDDDGIDGVFRSFKNHCKRKMHPLLDVSDINSDEVIDLVSALDADVVFSIENNMYFSRRWISCFENKLGIINLHYSALPRYGGYWPEMWAIWNDEQEHGVTLHIVDENIDAGPLVCQRLFEIEARETRFTLYQKCVSHAYSMIKEFLASIASTGEIPKIPQDSSQRTYFKKSLPNNGVLDLTWDEATISRFLRAIAYPGFPGPKIKDNGLIYTVLGSDLPWFKEIKTS